MMLEIHIYIWLSQCSEIASASMFRLVINAWLNDKYLQSRYTYIDSASKVSSYKVLKNCVIFEAYLSLLENKTHWCPLLGFKLSNNNLPTEMVRWKMYYYKVEYVHYVAKVILQMNFITFETYTFFKNKRK